MSQADELLNSLTEDSTEVLLDGNVLVDEKRVVRVPESLKKLGVQYDHDVNTVTFDCPRYSDGHDLSKMRVYVNYMRPDGEVGAHLCDNITIDIYDTNLFHFDWTISGHVTEVNGPLSFLVCIKQVDSDGNEVNHWNSELNTEMYISEGMKCADPIIRRHPDIITQMLLRMDEIEHLLELTENERILAEIGEIREDVDNLVQPDATLTKAGVAADAKATSDAIAAARTTAEDNAKQYTDEQIEIVYENFPPAIVVDTEEPEDIEFWIDEDDEVESGTVVTSYNGRTGAVMPQAGDVIPQAGDYDEFYYTKTETLSPETKTRLGLGADDTPDEAFGKVWDKATGDVGDILAAVRTDLGDNWLLCNGDVLDKVDYPALYDLVGSCAFRGITDQVGKNTIFNDIMYHEGTWVIAGASYNDSTTYVPCVYLSTDEGRTWTKHFLTTNNGRALRIVYEGGYWVAWGFQAISVNYPCVWVATDLTGEWVEKQIISTKADSGAIALAYHEGTWVMVFTEVQSTNYYLYVASATDPTGDWTYTKTGYAARYVYDLFYQDGVWIGAGYYKSTYDYPCFVEITSLTTTSTQKVYFISATDGNHVGRINRVYRHNDQFVLCGQFMSLTGVAIGTDITAGNNGSWTIVPLDNTSANAKCLCYHNGLWYVGSEGGLYTSSDLTAGWEKVTAHTTITAYGIAQNGDTWISCGSVLGANFLFYLPTVTHENAYTYIKAKED